MYHYSVATFLTCLVSFVIIGITQSQNAYPITKAVQVLLQVRGDDVKDSVAECMDTKMCLTELDGRNPSDSMLRNENTKQLQCLTGDSSLDAPASASCAQ